jgi:hypothetical protein
MKQQAIITDGSSAAHAQLRCPLLLLRVQVKSFNLRVRMVLIPLQDDSDE